jgi:hypothetical protein
MSKLRVDASGTTLGGAVMLLGMCFRRDHSAMSMFKMSGNFLCPSMISNLMRFPSIFLLESLSLLDLNGAFGFNATGGKASM